MKIISPIASGSGAGVIHKALEKAISGYHLIQYNPYLTLFPPSLYFLGRSYSADVIHTTPDYAIYHNRKDVPMVLTFHGFVLDRYIRQYSTFLQSLHYQTDLRYQTKKALPLATIITAVSNFTANLVREELNPDAEIRTIYNGVDESLFTPLTGNRKKTGDKIKVLVGGHHSAKKGSQWVKGIVDNLDDNISVVTTTGPGSAHQYTTNPRIRCIGRFPHSEMPSVYNSCDILLFPTVREGFGLAAAEAMSCGLPVVATNCSSLPELIEHGKGGYLCELGNVEEFADKINLLARDPVLRREMGEFNRTRIEECFSLEKMIKAYEMLFEEVLGSRN